MTKLAHAVHSLFAFSASPRWIACPASMAYPENLVQDTDGGFYADEGTAAHTLASILLKSKTGMKAEDWIGKVIKGGKREFEITEDFAMHVQTYVDDVQRRALGGYLMVEQRVTLDGVEGFDETNYGTSDAIIALDAEFPKEGSYGVVEDLKFGQGERVYAWTRARPDAPFVMDMSAPGVEDETLTVEPNYQLMMYALACLADIQLLIDTPKGILIVINQPRVGSVSELWVPIAVLERFALFAADALVKATDAMNKGVAVVEKDLKRWFGPGEKQCRWCKAFASCPAAAAKAAEETGADFEVIAQTPPVVPVNTVQIAKAMLAVPFVSEWCRAVMSRANEMVAGGMAIIGPDDKPYKFVEGKAGNRAWKDKKAAEGALLGALPPDKAYQPQAIITASAAAKLLDKKKTQEVWKTFLPLIGRAPGRPLLVLGSDDRPPYSPSSESDEFEVEEPE